MESFSNEEYADMHFVYGMANGNGRKAQRMYAENIQIDSIHVIRHLKGFMSNSADWMCCKKNK
jgi:hypothetical protein